MQAVFHSDLFRPGMCNVKLKKLNERTVRRFYTSHAAVQSA